MPFEHHLNADFDLSLRPRWQPPGGETARRRITDLAWHALFIAQPADSVLIPEPAPEGFVEYLRHCEIELPKLTVEPSCRSEQTFAPFGWNTAAADRNRCHTAPFGHPPLDVVALVNGRRFSARLERELFDDDHAVAEVSDETELLERLANLPDELEGWVLKAEHGNAGLGNRRLRGREPEPGDLTAVRRLFTDGDTAVLERWRRRLNDLCATFVVDRAGRATTIGLHETINTADGALIGSLFHEDPARLASWRAAMTGAAEAVAKKLADVGYHGPVCMDAFIWDDKGRHRLRPLADLNARREMSAGASALWRRLGGRDTAYWRFYTRRKIRLPENYVDLEHALGDDAYDPSRRRGVLVTAPLWLGQERRRPAKAALLFLAADPDEALALDRRFRERFEP